MTDDDETSSDKTTSDAAARNNAPDDPARRRVLGSMAAAGAVLATGAPALGQAATNSASVGKATHTANDPAVDAALRDKIKHVVVIYCENRSFNNLFADFPGLQQPLSQVPRQRCVQRDRNGKVMDELPPIWRGLVPHEQKLDGRNYKIGEDAITDLANKPWQLQSPDGTPLPNGIVTRDLMHRFYANQLQINGGSNDGFVAWGDSGALVMGHYDSNATNLELWNLAQEFTLCDNFFMGAFGGSFLNHQYLVAAQPPLYPNADQDVSASRIADLTDGPSGHHLKTADDSPESAMDGPPKFASHASLTPDFHAVNTFGPAYTPSFSTDDDNPQRADWSSSNILPPQVHRTIGDALSDKGVDWAWYAGGWQMAIDGKGDHGIHDGFPDAPNFQPHHQPLNYFRSFAPGTQAREKHLRDGGTGHDASRNRFLADIKAGQLPAVSFYKPQGNLNMHAGYSCVAAGSDHVHEVVEALRNTPQWQHTMVVMTVDENGGWWDHVAPPKADRWGPGTRIPALVMSPHARKGHVEHTVYDTGSIQRFLNRRFGLEPLPGILRRDTAMRLHAGVQPGDLTETLDLT